MTTIALSDQVMIAEAVTHFARLLDLDRIWTQYLADAKEALPDKDVIVLRALVSRMDQSLAGCVHNTAYLRDFFVENAQVLEQGYASLLAPKNLTDLERKYFQKHIPRGDILAFALSALEEIEKGVPEERSELSRKIREISGGAQTHGDLSRGFKCGVLGSIVAAGICVLTSGAALPVVLASGFLSGGAFGAAAALDC